MTWFKALNLEINWERDKLSGPLLLQTVNATAQINWTTTATDWAIKAQKNNETELPEHYQDYWKVFCENATRHFPSEREEDHEIKFTNDAPSSFKAHTYHMDQEQITFMRKWIDEELRKSFIRDSKSPWLSLTFLIKKKNGDYRVIQDYWKLNSFTVLDKTPLLLIPDLINQFHRKTLFTKFNICMEYNNIRIKEGDQQKATFTISLGQYKPMVMSFGLRNAPGTFMRTMNRLFWTLQNKYPREIQIYMDNILIATTNDVERHWTIVWEVLEIMKEEFLFLKLSKCEFEKTHIEYLGLILDKDTIQLDPTKVSSLQEWPCVLKTIKEVRSTLGLLNYHQAFIPGFSHIVKLLTWLLKKDQPFFWTTTCTNILN